MPTVHKVNLLLCEAEREFILEDASANLQEIVGALDDLEGCETIEVKLFERCYRAVNSVQIFKYSTENILTSRIFDVFHSTLVNKVRSGRHQLTFSTVNDQTRFGLVQHDTPPTR